ncbi:MAG: hypothetical protein HWE27_17235 [Gammaproteobacteria bacterium]|nr:hypothetical protein [Gammaproteobacteria bacterium]
MFEASTSNYLLILGCFALIFAVLGVFAIVSVFRAIKKYQLLRATRKSILCIIYFSVTSSVLFIVMGLRGFYAFNTETPIGILTVKPVSLDSFYATITLNNGDEETFLLNGDQVQIDANIVKWQPVANYLGLNTYYELDRISGRFKKLQSSSQSQLSAYTLQPEQTVDIIKMRNQFHFLSFLYDTEYGSGSFVPADRPAEYRVIITNSGIILKAI